MVKISRLGYQNPWWEYSNFRSKDTDLRKLGEKSIVYKRKEIDIDTKNIYSLWGPRQVGKTTWIKTTIANLIEEQKINPRAIMYLSCESISPKELKNIIEWFENSAREFENAFLFLDEITRLEKWGSQVKTLAERPSFAKTAVTITGSSPAELRRGGELFPGRGGEGNDYILKPLPFREFVFQTITPLASHFPQRIPGDVHKTEKLLKKVSIQLDVGLEEIAKAVNKVAPHYNTLQALFEIYLEAGGFPAPIENWHRNKGGKIENEVYQTFVRFVLGDLTKHGKNEMVVRQILDRIIDRLGTRYSYTTLSKDVDASHITTIDYLEMLEMSFILHILYSYDFTKKSPKYKADKKIYFLDPFIFYSICSWLEGTDGYTLTKEFLKREENKSKLVESVIASHLRQTKEAPYTKEPITFLWHYHDRKEIDFVYKKGGGSYLGIESKYKAETSPKEIEKIAEIKEYIILSKDDFAFEENTSVVPTPIFLALLKSSEKNL